MSRRRVGRAEAGSRSGPPGRRRPWLRRLLAVLTVLGLMAAAGLVFMATLPGVGDAKQRVALILSSHGGQATRLPVRNKVGQAILAVEDSRFFAHRGVDAQSVVRALVRWRSSEDQGGATISQQLAKTLYPRRHGSIWGKAEEVGLGLKLEQRYSKDEILQMYLNAIYYGAGHWGVEQAAQGFFGKTADQLDWAEASFVAGLPQAPSDYDPFQHFDRARRRQRHVLDRLVATKVLTGPEADAVYAQVPELSGPPPGGATR